MRKAALVAGLAALLAVACKPYDFDLDGYADLAWVDAVTGDWYRAGETEPFYLGDAADTPVPGDWNGDGAWDPARVSSDGVWRSPALATDVVYAPWTADPGSWPGTAWASGPDPVPGDYDGDGVWEPAWWRPSDGTWFIQGQAPVAFGRGDDVENAYLVDLPVPADYDGDGDTDLAVYRPTDGTFHVYGVGQIADLPFGLPNPADFDGDGAAEPAVYSETTTTWYIDGFPAGPSTVDTNGPFPASADYDGGGAADPTIMSGGDWYIGAAAPIATEGSQGYPAEMPPWLKANSQFIRMVWIDVCLSAGGVIYDDGSSTSCSS